MPDHRVVSEISATEASNRFADLLDAVEYRGETFTVVRRGRAIATIAPAYRATLGDLTCASSLPPLRPTQIGSTISRTCADFVGAAPTTDPQSD